MSGEGNRDDVTGTVHHKTQRSYVPRHWRTQHSLTSFFESSQHLQPNPLIRLALTLVPSNVPWHVRLTKPVIGIPLRHSLRQRLRVLLVKALGRLSLPLPPRISPKTLLVYIHTALTHSL